MAKNAVCRKAGRLERLFITRQYLEFDTCVIILARYANSSSVDYQLSKERLFPALASVLRKYAMLAVRVKDERTRSAAFERLVTVDFNSIVKFSDDKLDDEKDLSAFLEKEFMHIIPNSGDNPLWRLTVSADNYVVFAWSHVIGDGKSGLAFHRALLDALNNPGPHQTDFLHEGVVSAPDDMELHPPLEKLTELKPTLGTFVSTVAELVIPRSWYERSVWSGNVVVTEKCPATKTFVRCVFVSPETSGRLLALSRKHGTTLTGVIYVAAIGVLSNLLSERAKSKSKPGPRKFSRVSTGIAISLRPMTNTPDEAIGNIVSVYSAKEKLVQISRGGEQGDEAVTNFPWDVAASFSNKLRGAIPMTRRKIGMLKFVSDYADLYKGKAGKKREAGLEFSNLGAFKTGGRGGKETKGTEEGSGTPRWSIGRTCFVQDDGVLGAALKLSATGDPEGALNIMITWGEGAVDTEFAEVFVQEFYLLLSSLSLEV